MESESMRCAGMDMGPNALELCVALAMTGLLMGVSCRRNGDDGGAAPRSAPSRGAEGYGPYARALRTAKTEEERWKLTELFLRANTRPSEDAANVVEAVKTQLLYGSGVSEVWLDAYPDVRKRIELTTEDLEKIGGLLGEDVHMHWGEGSRDPARGQETHAYYTTELTRGEMARRWLLLLTGEPFDEKHVFMEWLSPRRSKLEWNQSKGVFVSR